MICQKCGMQNKEDALFCENCGSKIEYPMPTPFPPAGNMQNIPVSGGAYQAAKPMDARIILLVAEVLIAVLAAVFLYRNTANLFGAEKTGERYFAAVANGDWEKAYDLLEIEESEFINADAYRSANEPYGFPQVNAYTVSRTQGDFSEDILGTTVSVVYRQKGDSTDSSYTVYLNRQAKNKFLLFENWKVSPEYQTVKDYTIQTPKGTTAFLDGIDLSSYKKEQNENYDVYTIPLIFGGMHTMTVSMEGMETVEESFSVSGESSYTLYEMKPSETAMQQVLQMAGSDLQQIYAAALHGSTYASIAQLFTSDTQSGIEDAYMDFMEAMQEDEYSTIEAIAMSDISAAAESYMDDGRIVIEVYLPFEYSLSYSYEDWYGVRQTDTYNSDESVTFYFINENGSWVLGNLGCHTLYY